MLYITNTKPLSNVMLLVLMMCNLPQVSSGDGSSQIGMISKHWTGLVRELFTDAENFGISCKKFLPTVNGRSKKIFLLFEGISKWWCFDGLFSVRLNFNDV